VRSAFTFRTTIFAAAAACAACGRPAEPERPVIAVVPAPSSIEAPGGAGFTVTPSTVISVSPGVEPALRIGRYLSDIIGLAAGDQPLRVATDATPQPGIRLVLSDDEGAGSDGYELVVAPDRITITASDPAGLFYGVQTLRQLLPAFVEFEAYRSDTTRPVTVPAVRIVDRARFAWRGGMLDVARHFFSVAEVKRYIDLLAAYKFNRLHLHLSDDQGWRVEIKSWPNLTKVGGAGEVGGGPGGFYTQEEYREIVAHAADRFITIVPEIDMPGHTNAALASYAALNCDGAARQPYTGIEVGFSSLCVDKETTYQFIDDVVGEIGAMTPGPYFHIGGDEVKTLSAAQYVGFVERVQQLVQKRGKRMIGWDEIAQAALLPTTLVQHWRPDGSPAAAVAKGAKVIMSVANRAYLDMKYHAETPIGLNWAGYIDVRDAYAWDPATVTPDVGEAAIAGVEAPIWSETLSSIRDVEFMAFPRLAAIAEVAWSPQGAREWPEFARRLGAQAPRWTALGVNFYRSPTVPWQ
jgi:hexosaminidase